MAEIKELLENIYSEAEDIDTFIDEIYQKNFKVQFQKIYELIDKFRNDSKKVSTEELEYLLMELPLDMFDVSSKIEMVQGLSEVAAYQAKTAKAQNNDDKYKLDVIAKRLDALVERIQRESSAARELVMSAKKLWDSRQAETKSNPIKEISNLPDYTGESLSGKVYIK